MSEKKRNEPFSKMVEVEDKLIQNGDSCKE